MRFSSKILWKVYYSTWSCTIQVDLWVLPDQNHPRRFKKDHFKPLFCYLDRLALEFWQGSFLRSSSELEPSSAFINKLDWNNSTIFQLIITFQSCRGNVYQALSSTTLSLWLVFLVNSKWPTLHYECDSDQFCPLK